MDMSLSKFWEMVKDREAGVLQSLGLQRDMTEQLNNKTTSASVSHHTSQTSSGLHAESSPAWSSLPTALAMLSLILRVFVKIDRMT